MLDSLKMRFMCALTAVSVVFGSFAMPVNVWADDDEVDGSDGGDVILVDLNDLTDEEYLMAIPAGYNLAAKMDKSGKVSFLLLAAVRDGKVVTTMVN